MSEKRLQAQYIKIGDHLRYFLILCIMIFYSSNKLSKKIIKNDFHIFLDPKYLIIDLLLYKSMETSNLQTLNL